MAPLPYSCWGSWEVLRSAEGRTRCSKSWSTSASDHGGCRGSEVALVTLRCWPGRRCVREKGTRHKETGAGAKAALPPLILLDTLSLLRMGNKPRAHVPTGRGCAPCVGRSRRAFIAAETRHSPGPPPLPAWPASRGRCPDCRARPGLCRECSPPQTRSWLWSGASWRPPR